MSKLTGVNTTPVDDNELASYSYTVNTVRNSIAIGTIFLYGGTNPPPGYLLCDGSAVSRTTYQDLFAMIGTTYGAGDSTTTFNLPNFQGKMPAGVTNDPAGMVKALGQTGGDFNHIHRLGSHTHAQSHYHNIEHKHSMAHSHSIDHYHTMYHSHGMSHTHSFPAHYHGASLSATISGTHDHSYTSTNADHSGTYDSRYCYIRGGLENTGAPARDIITYSDVTIRPPTYEFSLNKSTIGAGTKNGDANFSPDPSGTTSQNTETAISYLGNTDSTVSKTSNNYAYTGVSSVVNSESYTSNTGDVLYPKISDGIGILGIDYYATTYNNPPFLVVNFIIKT